MMNLFIDPKHQRHAVSDIGIDTCGELLRLIRGRPTRIQRQFGLGQLDLQGPGLAAGRTDSAMDAVDMS